MRFALCAVLAFAATAAHADTSFEYLYVRAHEGQASGGHAALRFGGWVFDYQHDDGLLVPRREDAAQFQHAYRTLQNRSIESSRVEATAETVELLDRGFQRRVLAQQQQLEIGAALAADAALLAALRDAGEVGIDVRGAGFFALSQGALSPSLDSLEVAVVSRHGAAWASRRREQAEEILRTAPLAPIDAAAIEVDPFRLPIATDPIGRRLAQGLAARAAADLFTRPRRLAHPLRDAGEIDTAARTRLVAARAALLTSATKLAGSARPDWGEAFLRSAARLAALDASLAAGRWLVLDAMPASARTLPSTPKRVAHAPALHAEAQRDLDRARAAFLREDGFPEQDAGAVETAATRVAVLDGVLEGEGAWRVAPGALLPEGNARLTFALPSDVSHEAITRAAQAASRDAATFRARLEARYDYELTSHNCVTELFDTIDAIFAADAAQGVASPAAERPEALLRLARAESERRLGGHVPPRDDANFVPFVSSRNVRATWQVTERTHLPSAREYVVAQEGSLAAALREANTVTSRVYLPAEDDGFFLFFTDQAWQRPLRPLLGAANLTAGLARAGVGVLALPFDRGRGLRSGLDGALWSVPEFFFANVRKGTSEYVPAGLRPPIH